MIKVTVEHKFMGMPAKSKFTNKPKEAILFILNQMTKKQMKESLDEISWTIEDIKKGE